MVPLLFKAPLSIFPLLFTVKLLLTKASARAVPSHTPVAIVPTIVKAGKEEISSVPLILVQSGVLITPVTFKSPVTFKKPLTIKVVTVSGSAQVFESPLVVTN